MLLNYLNIAFRKLKKEKLISLINVACLALGLAVTVIIGMYARHKLSYDRFHANADRLYRVVQTGFAETPPGLAQALENRYPEFEKLTVVKTPTRHLFRKTSGETFYLSNILTADEHFFDVFRYPVLLGDPETMLTKPGQMVLTQSLALRLFGDENPVGKTFLVDTRGQYEISGLIADIPENTHFRFQAILSFSKEQREMRYGSEVQWPYYASFIYAVMHPQTDIDALEAKMSAWAGETHPYKPAAFGLFLQPVTEIHLHSTLSNEIVPQSDVRYLYFFAALALVVLGLVCINYMNLATARASYRGQEVGIRKIVGATRAQLMRQFLSESVLLSLIALPLALGLAEAAIPWLNRWTGDTILPVLIIDPATLATLAAVVLVVGVVSGSYPAFFLTAFSPATVLRKTFTATAKGGLLRKILVVSQFAATVMLICATVAIHAQLEFIRNKRLGFEKEYVVTYPSYFVGTQYRIFKQALLQSPHILAASSGPALGIGHLNMSVTVSSPKGAENERLGFMNVDYDYIQALDLELKAGRSFALAHPPDSANAVILNEAAAKLLGFSDTPIGKSFESAGQQRHVIGIVADFHNRSLKSPVQAIAFALSPGPNWNGLVRLNPQNVQAGLAAMRRAWAQFVPDRPFEYRFLSDHIARQYKLEQRMAAIFSFFAGLTIFIACLGLFGLAAYTAERRTKEIGIRKVLGANVLNVVALLSKDFVKLVLLANLIAWPIAWYAMNRWLQNFAYRIEIGWWVFVLAGGLALVIALVTVSTQAIRAALANPVESLRYE